MTGGFLPAAIFMMRDLSRSIPRSYEEAALVCGASRCASSAILLFRWFVGGGRYRDLDLCERVGRFPDSGVMLRSADNMPASVALYSFYSEAGTPFTRWYRPMRSFMPAGVGFVSAGQLAFWFSIFWRDQELKYNGKNSKLRISRKNLGVGRCK